MKTKNFITNTLLPGIIIFILSGNITFSQNIAITDDDAYTANPSAMLDVKAIDKGMLVPRLTAVQRVNINNPAQGLLVYDKTVHSFFFYDGLKWIDLSVPTDTLWWSNVNSVYVFDDDKKVGVGTSTPGGKLEVRGDALAGPNDPLFCVINNSGDTVFAVYPEGVRIYVADNPGKSSSRGGFAVGGFSTSKGLTNEYLRITPDSVRIYIKDTVTGKASRGGFAVGGFSDSKGLTNEYLVISPDSVRVYIEESTTKSSRGGFAVRGFSESKGTISDLLTVDIDSTRIYVNDSTAGFSVASKQGGSTESFLNLTKQNYFIGHKAGYNTTTGTYNSFIGYNAGFTNTIGGKNIFVGFQSGMDNLNGYENVFIGNRSGFKNTSGTNNVFLGNLCGFENTTGIFNIFIGNNCAFKNVGGSGEEGSFNTFMGYECAYENTKGGSNTMIGFQCGYGNTDGNHNTYVGRWAGQTAPGSYNVFVGTEAGRFEPGDYKLCIDAKNAGGYSPPLIYGEFDNRIVVIDGDAGDNPLGYTFYVNGPAGGDIAWNSLSDKRLKTNITTIPDALEKVKKLRGVNFIWKDKTRYGNKFQMGFIAQEAQLIIPEVVDNSGDIFTMQYAPVTALLVEAVKEQQKLIEELRSENENLSTEVNKIKSLQEQINDLKRILETQAIKK